MKALLKGARGEREAIDFSLVKLDEFIPSLEEAIEEARRNLEVYKKNTENTFSSVILEFEAASEKVDFISNLFYFYHGTMADDHFQKISSEFTEKITKFSNEVSLDSGIFQRIERLYESSQDLDGEQREVLKSYYHDFTRNGSLLSETDKEKLKVINERQSQVSLSFSKNVLTYHNDYFLHITNAEDISGVPKGSLEGARDEALRRKLKGWVFTLHHPSYLPLITYASSRKIRKEIYLARANCACTGELSNKKLILEALSLREKRAKLLGYENHASFVLERRMAGSSEEVFSFLDELKGPSMEKAQMEAKELLALFRKDYPNGEKFEPWDRAYYAEKLKHLSLDFDEEEIRPYFPLERVIQGAFQTAKKLYQIEFRERNDLPKYHEDVSVFEVTGAEGGYLGLLYGDFFPRDTKRAGAWMTSLKTQGWAGGKNGEVKRPHIGIVCNFTKPTSTKPSLLTLNEVLTLFHEFGHALHGLLSDVKYQKLSGTSVFWDFVELPSQIMENWVYEKECLDLFAKHYKTGELLPIELIEKVKKSQKFLSGISSLRQLSFGVMDMKYHTTLSSSVNIEDFETEIFKDFDVFQTESYGLMSCSFSHIFAGGYAAGYYSYKWAEVLDADAFESFQDRGIFNTEVSSSFKKNILSKGGTVAPMILYEEFRGHKPSVIPLLKRSGLM